MKKCNNVLLFLCSFATISCYAMQQSKRPVTPDPRAQQQQTCTNPNCRCNPCTCNPCLCGSENEAGKKVHPATAQALKAARKKVSDTKEVNP